MGNINMAPGVAAKRTATPRNILLSEESKQLLPGGVVLDGSDSRDPLNTGDIDVLRAGIVLGKKTSGGLYVPSIIGVLASAYDKDASFSTVMTVAASTVTELVRRVGSSGTFTIVGPPTSAGTVATEVVTYSAASSTTITVTAAAADYYTGSFIMDTDGSQTPLAILGSDYGVKVTDDDGTSIDPLAPEVLIGGLVDSSQIVNYPSDASLKAWLKVTKLNAVCQFTYDDDFGR